MRKAYITVRMFYNLEQSSRAMALSSRFFYSSFFVFFSFCSFLLFLALFLHDSDISVLFLFWSIFYFLVSLSFCFETHFTPFVLFTVILHSPIFYLHILYFLSPFFSSLFFLYLIIHLSHSFYLLFYTTFFLFCSFSILS